MTLRTWARAALLVAIALGGCDGPGINSPTSGRVARAGGVAPGQSLVGSWRRAIFFLDDFNYSRSNETTFQFASDGTFFRVQVARNFTLGLTDVLVSAGRWRLSGTQLVLDFVTPSAFQLVLDLRIFSSELELAGQTYFRVPT
jgi:hypothetical protein